MTERLKIALIPHQVLITSMRLDVVNVGGRCNPAEPGAVYAERMLAEKASPKPLPPGAIASCRGGTLERFSAPIPLAVFGLLSACRIFFMLLAKVLTMRHRMPTTRMFA